MTTRTSIRSTLRTLGSIKRVGRIGGGGATGARSMSLKLSRPLDPEEAGDQYCKRIGHPQTSSLSTTGRTSLGTQVYLDTKLSNKDYALPRQLPNDPPPPNRMFGQFLAILIKNSNVENVLEIGTSPGW